MKLSVMFPSSALAVSLFALGAVALGGAATACGGSDGTTSSSSTTSAGTGSATTGTSTGTGMMCGTGGGGTEDVCKTTNFDPICGPCMAANCCAATQAANGDAGADSVIACAKSCCVMECYPPQQSDYNFECAPPSTSPSNGACVAVGGANQCNPVTNEGCNAAAGEVCDRQNTPGTTDQIGYKCYPNGNPPVNIHEVCQPCNDGLGYCKAGLSCFAQCGKFCCADSDCSPGTCRKLDINNAPIFPVTPGLGLCVQ